MAKRPDNFPSPESRAQSIVERIAAELRERALEAKDGDSLGSEEELSSEFGVSRPTLRQAARLLQYEDLVHVKRGVHGGYYAKRPRLDTIARLGGMHLRANDVSPTAVETVLEALAPLTVSLVLKSGKTHLFAPFATQEAIESQKLTGEDMVRTEGAFARLMFELTGNPALRLIYSIFYQYAFTVPRSAGPQKERAEVVRLRTALAKALMALDEAEATETFLKYRRLINRGIQGNVSKLAKSKRKSTA